MSRVVYSAAADATYGRHENVNLHIDLTWENLSWFGMWSFPNWPNKPGLPAADYFLVHSKIFKASFPCILEITRSKRSMAKDYSAARKSLCVLLVHVPNNEPSTLQNGNNGTILTSILLFLKLRWDNNVMVNESACSKLSRLRLKTSMKQKCALSRHCASRQEQIFLFALYCCIVPSNQLSILYRNWYLPLL